MKETDSPFVRDRVELAVKLPHSDGLGVQDVCVYLLEISPRRRHRSCQGCHGSLQYLVGLVMILNRYWKQRKVNRYISCTS